MKKAIFLILVYFVCQFAATIPFIAWHFIQGDSNPLVMTDTTELSLSVILADIMMIAHLLFWKDVSFKARSFTEVSGKTLLLCIPLVLSAMYVLNVINEWLALPNWGENTFTGMSRNVWGIIAIAIGAPLVEELLFRGAVMNHLHKAGYTPRFMIVVSALLFGLVHINPAQIPFAFALGLLLAWLYYRTGSLVPGILCHFINNGLGAITLQSDYYSQASYAELLGGTTNLAISIAVALAVFAVTFIYARRNLYRINNQFGDNNCQ